MDDERFYELIRRAMSLCQSTYLALEFDKHSDAATLASLLPQIEHELRAREISAAVNRENARLALRGPG
jgi:hypothetical protein